MGQGHSHRGHNHGHGAQAHGGARKSGVRADPAFSMDSPKGVPGLQMFDDGTKSAGGGGLSDRLFPFGDNAKSKFLLTGLKHNEIDFMLVEAMLEAGADVLCKDAFGNTILHWASYHGRDRILRVVFDACAKKEGYLEKLVDVKNNDDAYTQLAPATQTTCMSGRDTALHYAIIGGSIGAVRLLLDRGWDANARNNQDMNPLLLAAMNGQVFMFQYLQEKYNADIRAVNSKGHTALHLACQFNHAMVVRHLIRHGFTGLERDTLNNVPGHYAAQNNLQALQVLLRHTDTKFLTCQNKEGYSVEKCIRQFGSRQTRYKFQLWEIYNGRSGSQPAKFGTFLNEYIGNKMYTIQRDSDASLQMTMMFFTIQMIALTTYLVFVMPWYLMEYPESTFRHYVWIPLAFGSTLLWWRFRFIDPGVIPKKYCTKDGTNANTAPEDATTIQLSNNSEYWEMIEREQTNRLCSTCMIVKPYRSKHSGHADSCVRKFDHHCGYMHVPISGGNYKVFILWAHIQIASMIPYTWSLFWYLKGTRASWYNPLWLELLATTFFCSWGPFFLVSHWFGVILKNITTNEQFNWRRYGYMQTQSGRFHNPFDLGKKRNMRIFCGNEKDPIISVADEPKSYPPVRLFIKELLLDRQR